MRILQIHNAYRQRGGEDVAADAEAALLEAAGHELRRIVVANPDGAVAAAGKLAVAAWNPGSARLVKRTVDEFRPDIAHVHNTWYSLSPSTLGALRSMHVPTVMTLHNYRYACLNGQLLRGGDVCELCIGRSTMRGVLYRCYRDSFASSIMASAGSAGAHRSWPRYVDRFIVMTKFAREKLTAAGLPHERMVVKPHHVADPGPRPRPPEASRTVVFIGRVAAEKGVDVLVGAWRAANIDGYDLVIAGDGPLRTQLAADAPPSVRFAGWLPPEDVRELMLGSRMLVFPSVWYETFGLSMVEAMAAGMPVLASDLGGTREIVGGASIGGLVPAGDIPALANRLRETVANGDWVAAAGREARGRYERLYTADVALGALGRIYQEAMAGSR